jgi:hypothetical protein
LAFSADGRWLAAFDVSTTESSILLLDALTAQRVHTLRAHSISHLVFSSDAKRLAAASTDHTVLVWDTSAMQTKPTSPTALSKELAQWWDDLGGAAVPAHKALGELVARPGQTVKLLCDRLKPVATVDAQRIAARINDLDDTRYAVRQGASQVLEQCGELAEPALCQALRNSVTLETRRRLEILLDKVEAAPRSRAQLTAIRAVTALEWISTAEARDLLGAQAKGAPEARLTQEAHGALCRLSRRAGEDR